MNFVSDDVSLKALPTTKLNYDYNVSSLRKKYIKNVEITVFVIFTRPFP